VIVEPEIEELSAVGKLAGQPKILTRGDWISGGMIVDEDRCSRPCLKRRPEIPLG
jgi:hypothetical protein